MNGTETIRGGLNFRELGGIRTADGRRVRQGMLYRSGGLHLMNEEELAAVKKLKIRSVLDLRDRWSQKKKPDPDIGASHIVYDGLPAKGAEHIDFSAQGFGQKGEAALAQIEKVTQYYIDMPYGYNAFHAMFDALKKQQGPFLIHCTKGKDRTGIACILILLALGADPETALKDYLRSNEYRKKELRERLAEGRSIAPQDEGYMTLMYLREGTKEELGRTVLDHFFKKSGTIEQYMKDEYGWDERDLASFRSTYLE